MSDPTFVPLLASALLHFLWQGALVGVLAWMLLSTLHAARPQVRYAVACLSLLACALLPLLTLAALVSPGVAASAAGTIAPTAGASGGGSMDPAMLATLSAPDGAARQWIVAVWASGVSALALRMAFGLLWIRRLRSGPACGDARQWAECVERLAPRFGIRRHVVLRMIAEGDSPLSIGLWKPMVLLPVAIAARMPAPLLEALIAHELAHIRRHDYLLNLLQGAVETLLFYHPVVWWLSHRIRVERELVADDLAARQLGDARRLALALAELDRLAVARSPFPQPTLAQAAHGGHLMSRIRQLIRPEHRVVGGTLLLPAIGIVALGVAFQAYAKLGSPQPRHADATVHAPPPPVPPAPPRAPVAPRPPHALPAQSQSLTTPPTPPTAPAPITPLTPIAPLTPPTPPAPPAPPQSPGAFLGASNHETYAVVRQGRTGYRMSGSTYDLDAIDAAKRRIDGDFIWLRRDGKAYVLRDPALLARVEQAWSGMQVHEQKMRELETRMQPHQRAAELLGERMDRLHSRFEETPEMRAAEAAIESLADQQERLSEQQHALSRKMQGADKAMNQELARQMQAIASKQQAIAAQQQHHADVVQAQHGLLQGSHARLEALAREMEAAAKPMEALGREMEAVGQQIEQRATSADRQVRRLIDEAVRQGLAQPAPSRQ